MSSTAAGGLYAIDKPEGISSNAALNVLRRRFATRRVGHAGTLDPLATGLLLVAMGSYTRLLSLLIGVDKAYEAGIVLGLETDSFDTDGAVVSERPGMRLETSEIEAALGRLVGDVLQVPPAFSALKVAGKRAYELARANAAVELAPRAVSVKSLELEEVYIEGGFLRIRVRAEVGSGTYIRSIAHDLGELLGTGGCIFALRRVRVGAVGIERAVKLEEVGDGGGLLLPEEILPGVGRVAIAAGLARAFLSGQPVEAGGGLPAMVYSEDEPGEPLGLGVPEGGRLRPRIVLRRSP